MKFLAWLGLLTIVALVLALLLMILSNVAPLDLYILRAGFGMALVHIIWKQWQGTWMP